MSHEAGLALMQLKQGIYGMLKLKVHVKIKRTIINVAPQKISNAKL